MRWTTLFFTASGVASAFQLWEKDTSSAVSATNSADLVARATTPPSRLPAATTIRTFTLKDGSITDILSTSSTFVASSNTNSATSCSLTTNPAWVTVLAGATTTMAKASPACACNDGIIAGLNTKTAQNGLTLTECAVGGTKTMVVASSTPSGWSPDYQTGDNCTFAIAMMGDNTPGLGLNTNKPARVLLEAWDNGFKDLGHIDETGSWKSKIWALPNSLTKLSDTISVGFDQNYPPGPVQHGKYFNGTVNAVNGTLYERKTGGKDNFMDFRVNVRIGDLTFNDEGAYKAQPGTSPYCYFPDFISTKDKNDQHGFFAWGIGKNNLRYRRFYCSFKCYN